MTGKIDDRFFYTFDKNIGAYHFYMATEVDATYEIIKAKKCRIAAAILGGYRSQTYLSWGSVGVFRFKPDDVGEELTFNKADITGKAICIDGHILSVPSLCLQET